MLDRTLGDEELPRGDVQQRQAPLPSLGEVEGCEVVILLVVQDVIPRDDPRSDEFGDPTLDELLR